MATRGGQGEPTRVRPSQTWDDVRRLALALPETSERVTGLGLRSWAVRTAGFVWERPLRVKEVAALGPDAPGGPLLGAYVPDLGVKEALLSGDPGTYLTTPHFDGYPVVLVRLDRVAPDELAELVAEAWLSRAPRRLAEKYLRECPPG